MSALIYRVQDEQGYGPYQGPGDLPEELQDLLSWHGHLDRTPHPTLDVTAGEFMVTRFCRFGFLDLDSFESWFIPEEREALKAAGFSLWLVEVEVIQWIGKSGQLTFYPQDAKLCCKVHY